MAARIKIGNAESQFNKLRQHDLDRRRAGSATVLSPTAVQGSISPARVLYTTLAGAVEDGALPSLHMRVEFDQGANQPLPRMGSYVVVPTDEPDVSLTFVCWLTHEDLQDPAGPDFDVGAQRDPVLDALHPRQALLVQVLPVVESKGDR